MSTTQRAHELTYDPVTGTYGFICLEHGVHRGGLGHNHALNVERQHIRDAHTPADEVILQNLVLDVTAMALRVGAAYLIAEVMPDPLNYHPPIIDAWEAMTGLDPATAKSLATHITGHHDGVTAAIVVL